jgi:hypothetical protein
MITRAGSGWQYVLADLSMILFMTTAAALSQEDAPTVTATARVPTRSEPVAVWRQAPGAPPLAQWLADQGRDQRRQLTIVSHYAEGQQAAALEAARGLLGQGTGSVRLIVEPGEGGLAASLAYDASPRTSVSPERTSR